MDASEDRRTPSSVVDLSLVENFEASIEYSEISDIRLVVANFIRNFAGGRNGADAWWYVAIEDESMNKDFLTFSSSVFALGKEEGMDLLVRCNILKRINNRFQFNGNGTEKFIAEFFLQDIMEVTRKMVKGDTKTRYFIRLGRFRRVVNGEVWKFTPAHQISDNSLYPPSTRMPKLRDGLLETYTDVLLHEHANRIDITYGCATSVMNIKEKTASKSFTTEDEIEILRVRVVELEEEVKRSRAILSEANDKIQTQQQTHRQSGAKSHFDENRYPVLSSIRILDKALIGQGCIDKIMNEMKRLDGDTDERYKNITPFQYESVNNKRVVLIPFLVWVDRRLENLSEQLLLTRSNYILSELKLEQIQDEQGHLVASITDMKNEKSKLSDRLKTRDNNNCLVLRTGSNERSVVKDMIDQLKNAISLMMEEKKHLNMIIETRKRAFRDATKKRNEVWKGRSWREKLLLARVEDVLKEFGVCMGQYHGRDLEGPAVRRLLNKASEIFERASVVLCDQCSADMKDEIQEMCKHYENLFNSLEGAMHFMRKPNGLVTDDDLEKFKEFVDAVMLKWRALGLSVTVKAHLLESHAFYQMLFFRGIGDFIEEFVEQLHQFTKRHKQRMGCLSDFKKECNAIAVWQCIESNSRVTSERAKVAEITRRKTKNGDEISNRQRKKKVREEKAIERDHNLDTYVSSGDLGNRVPTVHERETADFLCQKEDN